MVPGIWMANLLNNKQVLVCYSDVSANQMFAIHFPTEFTMETLQVKKPIYYWYNVVLYYSFPCYVKTFSFSNPIYADYYPLFISLSWLPYGVHIVVVYVWLCLQGQLLNRLSMETWGRWMQELLPSLSKPDWFVDNIRKARMVWD